MQAAREACGDAARATAGAALWPSLGRFELELLVGVVEKAALLAFADVASGEKSNDALIDVGLIGEVGLPGVIEDGTETERE